MITRVGDYGHWYNQPEPAIKDAAQGSETTRVGTAPIDSQAGAKIAGYNKALSPRRSLGGPRRQLYRSTFRPPVREQFVSRNGCPDLVSIEPRLHDLDALSRHPSGLPRARRGAIFEFAFCNGGCCTRLDLTSEEVGMAKLNFVCVIFGRIRLRIISRVIRRCSELCWGA